MISLMQEPEGMKSRREVLAAAIAGAVVLAARPLIASDAAGDPDARLREIFRTYGGEFGPARKGA